MHHGTFDMFQILLVSLFAHVQCVRGTVFNIYFLNLIIAAYKLHDADYNLFQV